MQTYRGRTAGKIRVTVVTPSYNQGKYVEKTIRSVLCQDYHDLEYIVMDGGSADETPDVLGRYERHIDVVRSERDGGQTDALNKGFALATGDVLAYLNADDCYAGPRVVSAAVEYFRRHPDADVIYGRRTTIDEAGRFVSRLPFAPFCRPTLYLADYVPQECVFWRRAIFERAGGRLDPGYDFAMDYELWLRFLSCGAKFRAVPARFGLFRCYPAQKSVARWRSVGLPEIARVQRQYAGRAVPETEMAEHHDRHYHGAGTLLNRARRKCRDFGTRLRVYASRLPGVAPADAWVFRRPPREGRPHRARVVSDSRLRKV